MKITTALVILITIFFMPLLYDIFVPDTEPQSPTVPYTGKEYGNDTGDKHRMTEYGERFTEINYPDTGMFHLVNSGKFYLIEDINDSSSRITPYFCDTIDWKQKFDSLIKRK